MSSLQLNELVSVSPAPSTGHDSQPKPSIYYGKKRKEGPDHRYNAPCCRLTYLLTLSAWRSRSIAADREPGGPAHWPAPMGKTAGRWGGPAELPPSLRGKTAWVVGSWMRRKELHGTLRELQISQSPQFRMMKSKRNFKMRLFTVAVFVIAKNKHK